MTDVSRNGVYSSLAELYLESLKACKLKFPPKKSFSSAIGGNIAKAKGRGMEFLEVRKYVPPDEIKNIDWKVSARLGGVYSKIFASEKRRPHFFTR